MESDAPAPRVVVVDGQGPRRSGRPAPPRPSPIGSAVAHVVRVVALAVTEDERPLRPGRQVEEAVRRTQQGGCPEQDRLEQLVLVGSCRSSRAIAVSSSARRYGSRLRHPAPQRPARGFRQVDRTVGHADQRVLRHAVIGVAGHPTLIVTGGPSIARTVGDGAPDAFGHVVGGLAVGTGKDGRELVAAVAIQAIAVARGRGHRLGDRRPAARRRPGGRTRR